LAVAWGRGEGGEKPGSTQPSPEQRGEGKGGVERFQEMGSSGTSYAALLQSRAWGAGPIRGQMGGSPEESEYVGEPTPQFKGKAGNSPRQKKKETSGPWQQRARGAAGWGAGGGEESLAQRGVGPPPAPLNPTFPFLWVLTPDGPTPAACSLHCLRPTRDRDGLGTGVGSCWLMVESWALEPGLWPGSDPCPR
jgi:hypothetical protein